MTELLVGSKKGLFVLRGEPGEPFDIAARAFPGDVVEYGTRDPRTGRYFASVTSGFYGPRLMYTDDPTGEWEQAKGPAFPEDIPDTSLDRIWIVQPGEADGVLYAGVAPAALFTSTDSGETWELNRACGTSRRGPSGTPAPAGSRCTRSAPGRAIRSGWRWASRRPASGSPRTAARRGARATRAWSPCTCRRTSRRTRTRSACTTCTARRSGPSACSCSSTAASTGPTTPARRGTTSRRDSRRGSGSRMVVDPSDPDNAYVIPLTADVDRVTPEGKVRVFETRDAGGSWTARGDGLPSSDAYLTILRQAFGHDGGSPLGLYFGATSGEVFGSADAGASWFSVHEHLAPVTSVRVSA